MEKMIINGGIANMNTGGSQTITNYHGNVDNRHSRNNSDDTYNVTYRLKYGERDLDDWKRRAELFEERFEALKAQVKADETIAALFIKLVKAIAKKFGF